MVQLCKQTGHTCDPWSSGFAEYFAGHLQGQHKLIVGIQCRFGDLEMSEMALLDTGAEWSLIGGETAELLQDQFGSIIKNITYITRAGEFQATLRRLPIRLLADEDCGTDIFVEATVAVAPDWKGPNVIGYSGFLERVRFALEPETSAYTKNIIYFDALGS